MFFSSKQYRLSINGPSEFLYSEGKRKALIDAEVMLEPLDFVIYLDSFHSWLPPFDKDIITNEDRLRIRENMSRDLEKKGLRVEWG
ncbi:MAG: hypothetical protein HRT35_09640 [Algicola sp.]|nr:hypothetical protein [Algicola sp.]